MEAATILHIVINSVPESNFIIRWIVSDDERIMRAHLCHPKYDPREKGKLPVWVVEPEFMADPGHRKKSVSKKIYKLATVNIGTSRVFKNIAKRIKKIGII